MIATRTTLPAATPRLEQATSPQAANTLPDKQHTFQRALSQNQHNVRLRDSSRTREPSPREVEARRQPQRGDNDRAKVDPRDDDADEKVDIRSAKPAVSEGQTVDAAVDVDAATEVGEMVHVSTVVVKDQGPTAPAAPIALEPEQGPVEEVVADDASISEESDAANALAQVVAVAAQLVEQATRSIASGQEVTATAGTTGEAAVMIESNKPKAVAKANVAMTMEVPVDAEDSILSSVASSKGNNHAAVTDQNANFGQGNGQQAAQSPAPVAASAATAPKAELSGGAIPVEAGGGGAVVSPGQGGAGHGPVSESISAQFAQLSQEAGADGNEEVNMGRLTRGLQSAINQRGGSVTLRLTPPELGAVRIEMVVRDGVVNAKFTAQTESVRNLLMDQMGQLRQALDRQGLSVDKIEVQVAQQTSGGAFAGSDRQADDMNRDGRSAGQYASQGDKGGQGEPGERGRDPRPPMDSFERAMADIQ